MKIVFLDIDGVLNWNGTEDRIGGYIGLCPERIARLNEITDAHPDAKIVISSTWRKVYSAGAYNDFDGLKKLLADRGVKAEIIGHTVITFSHLGRGEEIRQWVEGHPEITEYVVLDDDTEAMEPYVPYRTRWDTDEDWEEKSSKPGTDLRPHHVISYWSGVEYAPGYTEYECETGGLQPHHVKSAIDILNGKLIEVPAPKTAFKDPTWE